MSGLIRTNDTIAAIATGLTNAGISIIRISGDKSFRIISEIFKKKKNGAYHSLDINKTKDHTVQYGFIMDGDELIDEVMVLILAAPNTFTREDTVEIDCHGGLVVTRRILSLVLEHGARTADPGEFTKRAFLSGRIDLSQAEAVAGIINAKNSLALSNSVKQLGGAELEKIRSLRESIISDTAFIEAALDDPEHIDIDGFSETLLLHVNENLGVIERMIRSADNGRLISEGIGTVIIGRPNVGKSTLLNTMLGEDRAIVTDIAGTTRDTLEESISFGGISLNIIDTAGIRETEDVIERIGVDRALEAAKRADLILHVIDGAEGVCDEDMRIAGALSEKKVIVLVNKSDIMSSTDVVHSLYENNNILYISAKLGNGLDELEARIKEMFFSGDIMPNDEVYITSLRHKENLCEAKNALLAVKSSVESGMSEDFFAIDLMKAYTELGMIIGEDTDEDLVDRIFKDFCMGK